MNLQIDDQWRRNDSAKRCAAVEDRHAERSFADGEPFRNGFGCSRPVTGFAEAEDEAKETEAEETARSRGSHRRQRPDANRHRKSQSRSDAIVKTARKRLTDGIREQKP